MRRALLPVLGMGVVTAIWLATAMGDVAVWLLTAMIAAAGGLGLRHLFTWSRRLESRLDRLRRTLEREIHGTRDEMRRALRNEWAQFEALLGLYEVWDSPEPLPPLRQWSASPDLLSYLYVSVLRHRPAVVLECGSGASTLVLARALRQVGAGHLFSLEHEPAFAAAARERLEGAGLNNEATVIVAPLVDHVIGDLVFPWYSVDELREVLPAPVDLLFVDGPPAGAEPHARWPGLPLLADTLRQGAIILLDDAGRDGERDVLEQWRREFSVEVELLPHEKGTALIRWSAERRPSVEDGEAAVVDLREARAADGRRRLPD